MTFLIAEEVNLLNGVFLVGEMSKFFGCWVGFFPIPRVSHKCLWGYWGIILRDNPAGYCFVLTLIRLGFLKVFFLVGGGGGGGLNLTPLHISRRTYPNSIKLYATVKKSI